MNSGEFRAQGDNAPTLNKANRDMLLVYTRDTIFFPDESFVVFDSRSSTPSKGAFSADNAVLNVVVSSGEACR